MTLKLALGNVRRSARDYGVYFITLALAVAMFYAFNSLGEQAVLIDGFNRASANIFNMMTMFMQLFSVAVAVVLAFLVVYANRFLLKRRKREFGLYLMLGMSPLQVSKILLAEVAVVGVGALAAGILLGIAASQGMAFATAALMGATMSSYRFVISTGALLMTLACFAGIFILSAIVDVAYISRRKLADLVSTHELSEKAVMRNPVASLLVFVASIVILALAYWQLSVNGLVMMDKHFWAATALMLVGTTLFFWSLMGFVNALCARSKSLRFANLRIFTLRQLSSKVNTAFASMTVVCVMLFFAVTTMAGGFGMVKAFVGDIEASTQYDATVTDNTLFTSYVEPKVGSNGQIDYSAIQKKLAKSDPRGEKLRAEYDGDMAACFSAADQGKWSSLVKASAQVDYYPISNTRAKLLASAGLNPDDYKMMISGSYKYLLVSSIDQLNAARALTGKKPVELGEDEFLVVNSTTGTDNIAETLCRGKAKIKVMGRTLTCQPSFDNTELYTSAMASTSVNFFVPQSVVDDLKKAGAVPLQSYLDIMYKTDRASGDAQLYDIVAATSPVKKGDTYITEDDDKPAYRMGTFPVSQIATAYEMLQQALGMRMIITYLALYIGFVLMLTTAAVLAIQQLSEVADSLPRYRTLSTLGASQKQIARSLRHQTLAYFAAPLVVAACHTACALLILNSALMNELGVDMASSVAGSVLVIGAIYAVYYLVAYKASKSMVKSVLV